MGSTVESMQILKMKLNEKVNGNKNVSPTNKLLNKTTTSIINIKLN